MAFLPRSPRMNQAALAAFLHMKVKAKPQSFENMALRMRNATTILIASFGTIRAEFGAYMKYSMFLETGTAKMPARPHIRPAIFSNKDFITKYTGAFVYTAFVNAVKGGTISKDDVMRMWVQVLNSRPREHAVDSARSQRVYRYGFHIRSIHGYGSERSVSDIKAQQEAADFVIRLKKHFDAKNQKKGMKPNKGVIP
jgi:hypothetical protein